MPTTVRRPSSLQAATSGDSPQAGRRRTMAISCPSFAVPIADSLSRWEGISSDLSARRSNPPPGESVSMSLDDAKPHVVDASPYEVFVRSARAEPCMQDLVKKNYLDESVYEASARYARSSEFSRAVSLLQPYVGRDFRVLELGAGRGLTSLALAEQGVRVTAVE